MGHLEVSCLFSFQVFGDFPVIFMFFISSHEEHTLHGFNSFKFAEDCLRPRLWSMSVPSHECFNKMCILLQLAGGVMCID